VIAPHRHRSRAGQRGLTLIEVLVSVAILAMIATLIYGAFDSLSRGKKGEAQRGDRARQARGAIDRIARELTSAYLSMHTPPPALQTRVVAFIGKNGTPYDRVDFASFSHRRVDKEAKESDQAEIGFFALPDTEKENKIDLVRREQTPPDQDPQRGGVVSVLCENIESFDVRYLDPTTGQWLETWDSTQITSQQNRLPLEVKVTLVLKNVPAGMQATYVTKLMLPIQQPLAFGISR
jgi:general secretion pathway protein J